MSRVPLKIKTGKTYVIGVLNVTPDSFYDKGRFFDREKAITHAVDMEHWGADIIDVGGESTRPGAEDVGVEEELHRVMPVIEAISDKISVPISVDTRKAKVAKAALECGASIVNDVSALRHDPEMAGTIAAARAAVILMHMKGTPRDMQVKPEYDDVVKEIMVSLKKSARTAKSSGVADKDIIIDPGIGFGKTLEHNLEILRRLDEFRALGYPICIGTSRKSFIGKLTGSDTPEARLAGTLASCAIAIMKGAKFLRVHDVEEVVNVARVTDSIMKIKTEKN